MKKTTFAFAMIALSSSAFAQYHNDIGPIRDATSAARDIVKELELTNLNLVVGAPEYQYIYKSFLEDAKRKEAKFGADLDAIALKLSYDYSILKAMEGKPHSAAVKKTIEDAENRFQGQINAETGGYHNAVYAFITPPRDLMAKCLSTLCVNQVMEDYRKWINLSKKINEKICLYKTFALKKAKFDKGDLVDSFEDKAGELGHARPIGIEATDERLPIIAKYGIDAFSRFKFEEIKKYGLDMLLKHGLAELNSYGVADLEKYGVDNIKKYGVPALNKHGAVALNKYKLADLDKYGFALLEQYALEDLKAFGEEMLRTHGAEALRKYGVKLLIEASLEELKVLEKEVGLENLKAFGVKAIKNYPLAALKTYGVERLDSYGVAKLDKGVAKYGMDAVLEYDLDALDAFGVQNLNYYGASDLYSYGVVAIKNYGVSALKTWGVENLNKYGVKNLKIIDGPNALISGRAYVVGWDDSNELEEKHTICNAVMGVRASAVQNYSWAVQTSYPIAGGTIYAVPHVSGQMMMKTCPSSSTCRGWQKIYCAVEI